MKKFLTLLLILCLAPIVQAQNIAINADGAAPDASALLDVDATALPAAAKKGLLVPRIALTATNVAAPVPAPTTSLLIYNTATAGAAPNNVTPGYYYWNGALWQRFASSADGWLTTGNFGTVAGTNYIGTNDAVDWVIKTGGSAAANERARVRSAGQVIVNNTGILAGDVFSVYGNNTTNGTTASINNGVGTFAINGYSSVNGTGVYGETAGGASTAGTAVWGDLYGTATTASGASEGVFGSNTTAPAGNVATAATACGVRGEATGPAGTAYTIGVLGITTSTTGFSFGLYGQNTSPGGMGVFGANLDVSANPSHGIQGQTGAVGNAAGIRGFNTAAAIGAGQIAYGMRGSVAATPAGTGVAIGVRGDATGTGGACYGLYGSSASFQGFGSYGVNTAATGTGLLVVGNNTGGTYLVNGSGLSANGTGVGALGIAKTAASGVGLVGVGNNLLASIITPVSGCGVAGTGVQYGVMGFATTDISTNLNNNSASNGGAASAGGYFEVQNAGTAQTWAYVAVREAGGPGGLRKIIGPGTVNTIVKDLNGDRVALSCPEAPENLFQDYGAGQLVNGRAHVTIDPILAKNIVVDGSHPLRVFVQMEGDCNGVYVTSKSATGFDVVELAGGTSNTAFSYTVVANRADEVNPDGSVSRYSAERFAPAPGPQSTVRQELAENTDAASQGGQGDKPLDVPVMKPKPRRVR